MFVSFLVNPEICIYLSFVAQNFLTFKLLTYY